MVDIINYSDMEDRERARCVSVLQTITVNISNPQLTDVDFREFVLNSITTIPQMLATYESVKKKFDITAPAVEAYTITVAGKNESVTVSRAAVYYLLDVLDRQLASSMLFSNHEYKTMFDAVYTGAKTEILDDCYKFTHTVAQAALLRNPLNFTVA